jgi:hypothetical protein
MDLPISSPEGIRGGKPRQEHDKMGHDRREREVQMITENENVTGLSDQSMKSERRLIKYQPGGSQEVLKKPQLGTTQ